MSGYRFICYGKRFFYFFKCLLQRDVSLHIVGNFSFEIQFEYQRKIYFLFPVSYRFDEGNFAISIYHLYLFSQFCYFIMHSRLLLVFFR